MHYIKFHTSFDPGWLTAYQIFLYWIYFQGVINLEFDFLFREWAVLKFFNSACFLKFSPTTKQFDARKRDKLGLHSFYDIMSLANFEILSIRKFEN